ncbi:hypothetical protein C0J52_00616 [Blattella germanica]|nr:hypothetical protein C0J52_00616 [Blattella germanica]
MTRLNHVCPSSDDESDVDEPRPKSSSPTPSLLSSLHVPVQKFLDQKLEGAKQFFHRTKSHINDFRNEGNLKLKYRASDWSVKQETDSVSSTCSESARPGVLGKKSYVISGNCLTVTNETIKKLDGTVEHKCTLKDSRGNEKTVVIPLCGDNYRCTQTLRIDFNAKRKGYNWFPFDKYC